MIEMEKLKCIVCGNLLPKGSVIFDINNKHYCAMHGEDAAYEAWKQGSGKSKFVLMMYKEFKKVTQ